MTTPAYDAPRSHQGAQVLAAQAQRDEWRVRSIPCGSHMLALAAPWGQMLVSNLLDNAIKIRRAGRRSALELGRKYLGRVGRVPTD